MPEGFKQLFYLSWEDALWDILVHKKVKKKSNILVPDFYCTDVEENIKKHGYRVVRYKILPNLKAGKKSFAAAVRKYKPPVIVVFHPVGIKSNLFDSESWLARTAGESILIEDSVHKILNPRDLKIIKSNHFIIDSLRKVVPLQGSRVFGKSADLNFDVPSVFQSFFYFLRVNTNCFLMNICLTLGIHKLAERLMLDGYDLIGDAAKPARGSLIAKFLSSRLNTDKIQKLKEKQTDCYEQILGDFLPYKLKLKDKDKKHLRGYPVVLQSSKANKVLSFLRNRGLMVRFELEESNWGRKYKIIYLPLGFQMRVKNQKKICNLVKSALKL